MYDHNLSETTTTKSISHCSGFPVDKIHEDASLPQYVRQQAESALRSLIGSFNWLAATRPDIATITKKLAQYLHKAVPGYVAAAKYVLRYSIGTPDLGIEFSPTPHPQTNAFVKFPIPPSSVTSLTDANWGDQDQSLPRPDKLKNINLFKSRSLSGFIIWMGGPLHWTSIHQSITARSLNGAEIYAIDKCVKSLQHISHISQDLHLSHLLTPTFNIYNNNEASVKRTHKNYQRSTTHPNERQFDKGTTRKRILKNSPYTRRM